MNNNEQFISKLIDLTKSNKISWSYLDESEQLCDNLNLYPENDSTINPYRTPFEPSSGFYVEINSNFIVLYKLISNLSLLESLRLKTVPSTFKDIQNIELKENKELMLRLLNVVKSQFPNSEDIIKYILDL